MTVTSRLPAAVEAFAGTKTLTTRSRLWPGLRATAPLSGVVPSAWKTCTVYPLVVAAVIA